MSGFAIQRLPQADFHCIHANQCLQFDANLMPVTKCVNQSDDTALALSSHSKYIQPTFTLDCCKASTCYAMRYMHAALGAATHCARNIGSATKRPDNAGQRRTAVASPLRMLMTSSPEIKPYWKPLRHRKRLYVD